MNIVLSNIRLARDDIRWGLNFEITDTETGDTVTGLWEAAHPNTARIYNDGAWVADLHDFDLDPAPICAELAAFDAKVRSK